MTTDALVYKIPSQNIQAVRKHVQKHANKAKKLGFPPTELRQLYTIHEEQMLRKSFAGQPLPSEFIVRDFTVFELTTTPIKIEGGWHVIGVVNHMHSAPVIHMAPGYTGSEYRTTTNKCDHCGYARNRIETILLEDDEGNRKQIGRNCAADFFGRNVTNALQWNTAVHKFFEDFGEYMEAAGGWDRTTPLSTVLAMSARVIREHGWMSRGRAEQLDGIQPTSGRVSYHLYSRHMDRGEVRLVPEQQDHDEAEAAAHWAANISDEEISKSSGDYLFNIRTIARDGYLVDREFGLGVSIVAVYQRTMERLKEQELARSTTANSQHVGEPKQRMEMVLTVNTTRVFEGQYGPKTLHNMVDDQGNAIKWWASGSVTLDEGKTYKVMATVKTHDEYKGRKETVVNRIKVVEELSTEAA